MNKLILIILTTMLLSGCTAQGKIESFVQVCQDSGGVATVRDNTMSWFATIYLECEPLTPQQ